MGAGNSNFAQEANLIPETQVIQLDGSYSEYPPTDRTDKICGAFQALPFADGIFDETVASYSTLYVPKDDIKQCLKEMLRVTKKGGTVKIFPVAYDGYVLPSSYAIALHPNAKVTSYDSDLCFFTLEIKKEDSDEDLQDMIDILLDRVYFGQDMIVGMGEIPTTAVLNKEILLKTSDENITQKNPYYIPDSKMFYQNDYNNNDYKNIKKLIHANEKK